MKDANSWIKYLRLTKHPEGGYFREVYRAAESVPRAGLPARYGARRTFSTSIYFLLKGSEVSRFHRLKSDEVWHFYAGDSLTIHVIDRRGRYKRFRLGGSHAFQCIVPHGDWFGATVDGNKGFALAGCTVAPGFDFVDFEMAKRSELVRLCPKKKRLIERLTQREDLTG